MSVFKLIVGSKAYSSWSFRPWLLLAHFKIPFEDVTIGLRTPETRDKILKYSPTGKVPCLIDGSIKVWDSLAIMEYVAECYPANAIWPKAKAARAHARAISAEMHSGFQNVRNELPCNFRRAPAKRAPSAEAQAEIERIEAIWAEARSKFGKAGPFLYGKFSAADAMYAPVVSRFHAYAIAVSPATRAYMDAMMALPAWAAWLHDGKDEIRIPMYED